MIRLGSEDSEWRQERRASSRRILAAQISLPPDPMEEALPHDDLESSLPSYPLEGTRLNWQSIFWSQVQLAE